MLLKASTNLALLHPFSAKTSLDCLIMLVPASSTPWSLPVLVRALPVLRLVVAHRMFFPQEAHMPGDFYIDKARFVTPERFWPQRFMTGVVPQAEHMMPHYGFGVGCR